MKNSDELAKAHYAQCHYELIDYKQIFDTDILKVLPVLKAKGLKIGCASNSNTQRLRKALNENGILNYFDAVISMEMVSKGKPDPAVYQLALKELDVDAQTCLAIEDSAAGIKAAKRVGCVVAAKKHPRFKINQIGSDVVIDGLCEVVKLIN